jgi:hypothetical protein
MGKVAAKPWKNISVAKKSIVENYYLDNYLIDSADLRTTYDSVGVHDDRSNDALVADHPLQGLLHFRRHFFPAADFSKKTMKRIFGWILLLNSARSVTRQHDLSIGLF